MGFVRELGAAGALALGRPVLVAAWPAHERAQGLAWLPLGGLLVGGIAVVVMSLVERLGSTAGAALLGAAVLGVAQGWPPRPLRIATGLIEALALLAAAPAVRTTAVVVAPMLARWACVVQCYGGAPSGGVRGLATLAGRARFREFAIASVTALGTSLAMLDAVGLAVAVACALVTMPVRLAAYRRTGVIGDGALGATSALVETSALVLLVSIGLVLDVR